MKVQTKDEEGNPLSDFECLMKVGHILKKTGIDELPQFFYVLKGIYVFSQRKIELLKDIIIRKSANNR